jgi:hypothetical protein
MYRSITLVLTLIGLTVAAPHAQDSYVRQAQIQLTEIARVVYGDWEMTREHTGSLDDDESFSFSIWLRAGATYVIRATCDEDCSDVDLVLTNSNDRIVAFDRDTDDTPLVRVRPAYSGIHTIRVEMASCRLDPCGYAVGIFRR